jgi:hypothetical protein
MSSITRICPSQAGEPPIPIVGTRHRGGQLAREALGNPLGARVLGDGGPLCGGVAARPNPTRTDGRFQVIFFARPII